MQTATPKNDFFTFHKTPNRIINASYDLQCPFPNAKLLGPTDRMSFHLQGARRVVGGTEKLCELGMIEASRMPC